MSRKRKTDKEIEDENFEKALKRACKIVASWPEWKRKACEAIINQNLPYDDSYLDAPG